MTVPVLGPLAPDLDSGGFELGAERAADLTVRCHGCHHLEPGVAPAPSPGPELIAHILPRVLEAIVTRHRGVA